MITALRSFLSCLWFGYSPLIGVWLTFTATPIQAQTFDLFRLNNLLAPGLTVTSEYRPERNDINQHFENSLDLSIPLKGTVGVRTDVGELFKIDEWKDLTRVVKPDIRQRFLDVGGGYGIRPEPMPFDPLKTVQGYVGVSGLRYLDKRYFLLWGARGMYSESLESLDKPGVRVTASAGTARFTKRGFIYYYGLAATYNDGRFLPVPWGGGQARLPWGSRVRVLLPRELAIRHRFGRDKAWQLADWELAIRADARFRRTGILAPYDLFTEAGPLPGNLEVWELRSGASLAWRIPESQSWLQLYGGYTPVRWLTQDQDPRPLRRITPSDEAAVRRPFVELSFTTSLGKDMLNLDIGKLLMD